MNYIAIMAGGVGSRFWPSSREALPKQFLDILGIGKSLIRLTYERCLKLVPNENILIVTNKQYRDLVHEHLPELPIDNILCEPSRNNTAPCVAYTALRIESQDPNASMAILPSDHIILKEDVFIKSIKNAFLFAKENNALLTLGIEPTRPDTGYGYIQMGEKVDNATQAMFEVKSFREKPNALIAQQYIDSGNYVWNAGIFVWSVKSILDSFKKNASNILNILEKDKSKYGSSGEQAYIDEVYPKTENISVDYAIMEKSDNVFTMPVDIGWSDLGTWASLHHLLEKNSNNSVLIGKGQLLNSKNSLIKSLPGKLVVVEGLDDFIVIDEEDVLLIWPKNREQEVKILREKIKESYKGEYL